MTTVTETISLDASPTEVWSFIGDFDRLDSWHPAVASSETVHERGDRIRHLTLGDGSKIVERLDAQDDEGRSYTYTILEPGPLPVQNYQSTLSVTGDATATTVTWSSEFEPRDLSEAEAQETMSGVYTGGFSALLERFGAAG